jgi:hypothetical protein
VLTKSHRQPTRSLYFVRSLFCLRAHICAAAVPSTVATEIPYARTVRFLILSGFHPASRRALSKSSARTTKRFPLSSRCVSTVHSIDGYKPPSPIPGTQSAFHPRAQRSVDRGRDVRQLRRSFALCDPRLRRSPNSNRFAQIVCYEFPVFHVDSILRFSSVQSGHMVSLGKLRADFPELASWTISNASSNEYRPASARRFVYP